MRIKQILAWCFLKIRRDPHQIARAWVMFGVDVGEGTMIFRNVRLIGASKDPIHIGRHCVLTGCHIIGHDAAVVSHLKSGAMRIPTIIEDNCFIGYGAIILTGVTVGKGSVVGAGSVVASDVPANMVVAGNPAKVICSVDDLVKKRQELRRQRPEYFTRMSS
ncbi:serine O-acetyltransferase [Anaerolineae bacterium]|nr:serine O-acetyltransferase [Anaerolineae bacterium]